MNLIEKSQHLFYQMRMGSDDENLTSIFTENSKNDFESELTSDKLKVAFWVNVYNAYSFLLLRKNPDVLKAKLTRGKHFTLKQIPFVGGSKLSLDDIEHGILRKGNGKGLFDGFINGFRFAHLKPFMVEKLDPRIHFALNCGGAGCPAIRFYEPGNIDFQLNNSKELFIEGESHFNEEKNELKLSQIFKWYQKDFGGEVGIRKLINSSESSPENSGYSISYKRYDWTLDLENIV